MGRKSKSGQCRFCLETDTLGNLISPCLCKGTFQYVHNECLLKWYSHNSDKGLQCGVCLEEYEKGYDLSLESVRPTNEIYVRCMKKPLYYIMTSHCVMYFTSRSFESEMIYYLLHFLYHFTHFAHFLKLVKNVKNRGLYRAFWLTSPRIFIPVLIMFEFLSMVATKELGAFTTDILLFTAINEHYEVLSQINANQKFFFKDRSRRK
jgi:hypothetical protein